MGAISSPALAAAVRWLRQGKLAPMYESYIGFLASSFQIN